MYIVLLGSPKGMHVIADELDDSIDAMKWAVNYIERENGGYKMRGSHGQLVSDGKGTFKDKLYIVEDKYPIHHFWVVYVTPDNRIKAKLDVFCPL